MSISTLFFLGLTNSKLPITISKKMNIISTPKAQCFTFSDLEIILIEFSTTILAMDNESEIAEFLAKNCISKLEFVDCAVYFLDKNREFLVQKAACGTKNTQRMDTYSPLDISVGKGISGAVAETGIGEIVNDTTLDSRYIVDGVKMRSEIAVPIIANNEVLGVIDCEHPEKGFFTEQHFRVLSAFTSIFAIKLDGIRKERENRAKEIQLLEVQREMLALKATTFRSQLSPHFVFNSLNAIQHFVTTCDKENTLKYFSIFSKLIRYYISNFESETVSLDGEVNMLEWYLKLQQLRYEGRFTYGIDIKRLNNVEHIKIPSLILPMLVEHVVETTVGSRIKQREILLTISPRNEKIDATVKYSVDDNKKTEKGFGNAVEWEEQVERLNKIKNYRITKSVDFTKEECRLDVTIKLSMPILE